MRTQPPGGVGSARRLPRTPQLDQAVGLVSGQGPPAVADTTMRARAPRAGGSPAAPAPATPRQQYRHGGATSQGAQTCVFLCIEAHVLVTREGWGFRLLSRMF